MKFLVGPEHVLAKTSLNGVAYVMVGRFFWVDGVGRRDIRGRKPFEIRPFEFAMFRWTVLGGLVSKSGKCSWC
jgi:hypothetical protein